MSKISEKHDIKTSFDSLIGKAMENVIKSNGKSANQVTIEINNELMNILEKKSPNELGNLECNNLKVSRYMSGTTAVPAVVLLAFCRSNNLSTDTFFDKINKAKESSTDSNPKSHEVREFLCSVFHGNDKFNFSFTNPNHMIPNSIIFSGDSKSIDLNIVFLKTHDKIDGNFQKGKLVFIKQDGLCYVKMTLDMISSGASADYEGFALFMNLETDFPACICYLTRTKDKSYATAATLYFRLMPYKTEDTKNRNGEDWMARCGFILNFRALDRRPLAHKMLLYKSDKPLTDANLNYLNGHLKMNTGEILIPKLIFDATKEYLSNDFTHEFSQEIRANLTNSENKEILEKLNKHFDNKDKEKFIDILDSLENNKKELTFLPSFTVIKDKELLKQNHVLTSWLRKNEYADDYNRIFFERDEELDKLIGMLQEEEKSEK